MTYITTEYEAEAIAKRRRASVTIGEGEAAIFDVAVTILSWERGERNGTHPFPTVITYESDGPATPRIVRRRHR